MNKLLSFTCLIFIFSGCSSYNYKSTFHPPSVLFNETELSDRPENWSFYVHDGYGRSHKGRSTSIDSNSINIVVKRPEPIDLPEVLQPSQSNRKNEIHVFVNDSTLAVDTRLEFQESDIKEVVMYSNGASNKGDNATDGDKAGKSLFIILMSVLGVLGIVVVLIVNSIVNQVGGYCYIATMSYGAYDAPEVKVLRRFRDEKLRKTFLGRVFIANYYTFSPLLVKFVKKTGIADKFIRRRLDRFVNRLKAKHNW